MFSTIRRGMIAALLLALFAPVTATAQGFDCAAYENYAGAEPDGYAEACIPGYVSIIPKGNGNQTDAPTDTAFAHDLRNTDNTFEHQQGDLASNMVIGSSLLSNFGYDFSPDTLTLYAIDNDSGALGTFDGSTLTPVGTPTRPAGHTWTGLSIDPATGDAYLSSTDGTVSTLHSVDLSNGSSAAIGNVTGSALLIDISVNCESVLYGHDIGTDTIFTIDTGSGATTPVGSTGVNSNFAQGMDFDNESGELYAYTYQGGGANQYGTIDLGSGALTPINIDNPLGEWEGASQTVCAGGVGPARFQVFKAYDDGNTGEVEVTLSCNTGLPLEQTIGVAPGAPINFVVNDFAPGTMSCTVTEVAPDGYTASYDDGDGISDTNCSWTAIEAGQNTCTITNSLEQVDVEVTKVWIDENPQFNAQNVAGANWSCTNVAFGDDSGTLDFFGNPGVDSFSVYPDWDLGTTCSITEVDLFESGVEVDDSECQGLVVWPGIGATCTIYNTRLYEGIPTLSQYGLAVLALMMLGVGLIGFRRFI